MSSKAFVHHTSLMNLRSIAAWLLCGALAIGVGSLLWRSLPAGIGALSFALIGAFVARLFSQPQQHAPEEQPLLISRDTSRDHDNGPAAHLTSPARKTALTETVPVSELLEAMMNSMREGMLVVDGEMRVLASNRAARNIFNAAGEDERASRRLSDLTRHPSILSAFQSAVERGEQTDAKVELTEMERRTFDLRVAPLQSRGRRGTKMRGAVGVFFDITRLERLERVRQEFLSNVSHELRTPLTAILTFTETLMDGAINDAQNNQRFLSIIERNASRMHSLIDDILELSAIEAGNVKVEIAQVRLHSLVNDVLTALALQADAQQVALRNEVSEDVLVQADARRLEQMLTNLVDNSIKFNRAGGEVRISHERSFERDRITVADTGEGISAEHIKRIFERFYRVDRARSRSLGGTGLGLAIVKHLARAHGGEAMVHSIQGEGSIFTIELPNNIDVEKMRNNE